MNPFSGFLSGTGRSALLTAAIVSSAFAQSATGLIEGRIQDSTSGKNLQGAIIRVVGQDNLRAETLRDGSFILRNVPVGTYEVEVSYFGFAPRKVSTTVAASGTPSRIDVDLGVSPDVVTMDTITVEADATGQARATNQQRVAQSMVNVTSAEQLGSMTDNNIATALQRLPGLSANADTFSEIPRYVNIRGFNADLNSVQLNGNRLPTSGTGLGGTDGAGDTARAFALDDIPGNSVTMVEVIKAPTPDKDGDAVGGIVNMVTKSAFDRTGRSFEFQVGADYVELREKIVPNFSLGYSDLVNDKTLGVRVDFSYSKGDEGFDNIDYDSFPLPAGLAANQGYGLVNGAKTVFAHEDTEYNNYLIERDRYGVSLGLDYKLNDVTTFHFKPVYTLEERNEDDVRFHKIMDNDHGRAAPATAVSGTSFALTPIGGYYNAARGRAVKTSTTAGTYSTYSTISETAGTTTLLPNGTGRGSVGYRQSLNEREIEFYSLDLGGKTEANWGQLEYGLFNSKNAKDEDLRSTRFDRNGLNWAYERTSSLNPSYNTVNGIDPYALPANQLTGVDRFINPSSSNITAAQIKTEENVNQANIDLEVPFGVSTDIDGKFKTGVKFRAMERESARNQQYWRFRDTAAYNAFNFAAFVKESDKSVGPFEMPYYPDTAAIIAAARNGEQGLIPDTQNSRRLNSLNADYEASEDTLAGYAMGTFDVGSKFQITTGARVEQNWFSATTPVLDPLNLPLADVASTTTTDENDYTVFLPGIHLRYEAAKNIVFRAAYTNTYGRPAFRESVGVTQFDDVNNTITTGNPDLKPFESKNYDLSAEYFGAATYLQVALFHKAVANTIVEFGDTILGSEGYRNLALNPSDTYTLTTFKNEAEAINRGVEVASRYRFISLPSPLDGFYLDGSATYTDSDGNYADRPGEKLPTYGASEWLFNAGLGFEKGRYAAQLSYRYRSPYLEGLETVDRQNREAGASPDQFDDWWGVQEYWNWESSVKITKNFKVYVNITNIFEYTNVGYQSPPENGYQEDSYWHQRRWSFGVKGTF